MGSENMSEMRDFVLGTPAIVCRWRLANRQVLLENRHVRALSKRTLGEEKVPTTLVAWVKQHLEWTLKEGAFAHPDGVLMLVIDEAGQAAMTVGPYEPLAQTGVLDLAARAALAHDEAERTGIAPECLWLVQGDTLVWGIDRDHDPSGASTLVNDLAHTLGLRVARQPGLAELVGSGSVAYDGAFLVSDEHGVVAARNLPCALTEKFAASYQRLFEKTARIA